MQRILTSIDGDLSMTLNHYTLSKTLDFHIASVSGWAESRSHKSLYYTWKQCMSAQQCINKIKAHQLDQIADLFEEYPALLKVSTDPSQVPRSNTNHVVQ